MTCPRSCSYYVQRQDGNPGTLAPESQPHTASFRPFPALALPVVILLITLLLVYPTGRGRALAVLPVPGTNRKSLWHRFLDQVAMSSGRLAESSGITQR